MRKIIFILFASLLLASCGKDDENFNNAVPDPTGTASYTLVSNTWSGGCENPIDWLTFTGRLNLQAVSILTVGKVNGLGNITKIPTSGLWSNEAAAILNYGYIVKKSDNTYIRVFISNLEERWEVYNGTTYTRFFCTIKYAILNP